MLFELPEFDHVDARTLEEAVFWCGQYGENGRVVAGGTDLLGLMKDRIKAPGFNIPEVLINIKKIPELKRMVEENQGLKIGAAVTLHDLVTSGVIEKRFPILSEAARQVGTTHIRYMGTIGGNLCQRPRCLYFRHPDFLCFKKGGSKCYAVAGEHRYYHSILKNGKCVMAHPSDIATAMAALNATIVVAGPGGEKNVPILDFFQGPNDFAETVLKSDEIVTQIKVPYQGGPTRQIFLKSRIRHSADFALSSVAAVAEVSDAVCNEIRIILGGVAPFPYRAFLAEEVVRGKRLNEGLIPGAAEASVEGARPLRMNDYKIDLTKALVRQALTSIFQSQPADKKQML